MPDPVDPLGITSTPSFPPAVQPGDIGRYPAGFRLSYTFYDPAVDGESAFAPQAERVSPAGGGIGTVYYWLGAFGTVHGEPGLRVYLSLQPWHGVDYWTPFQPIASYPAGFTSGGSSEPTAYELSPVDALIRLLHGTGAICWEHDGRVMRIKSGGVDQIATPVPRLTSTPTMLACKDPASDVLAFCPEVYFPRARADILTAPPVPTATVDLCTQLRCGVADACTGHLLSLYSNWARWLSPLFALLGTLAVAAFIEEILPMLLAEEASASTLAIWQEFKPEIQGVIGVFTGNLLPLPTSDTTSDIKKMLFCQLVCEEGIVRPTATQINGWRNAFLAYPDWAISSLQGQLLELLTKFTPLEDWLIAAEGATTSSACDSWTCP